MAPTFFYPDIRDQISFSAEKMRKISLVDSPRGMVDLYCARPGQGQRPHVHAGEDKVYYVVEGHAEFQIGGETRLIGAGGMAVAPAGVEHGMTNPGPGSLVVLVTIAPPIPH